MKKPVTEAHVERPRDHSSARQPLRLEIGRRLARSHGGAEKFITEVRFGDTTAVVVPWREDRLADRVAA
jgi:hypothetical protein